MVTDISAPRGSAATLHRLSAQPHRPGVGTIVATGDVTKQDFGMFRGELAPGASVASHFHLTFSESFYVLRGQLLFHDGHSWAEVSEGDLLYVPRAGIHGLRVPDDAAAEILTIFTPGIPRERFVMELLEIRASDRSLTSDEWAEFYARHDQYMV